MLAQGYVVHAIANCNVDRLVGLLPQSSVHSIADDFPAVSKLVQKIRPDILFHLAAVHAEPPTFDQMMGMLNCSLLLGAALLDGAASCKIRPVLVHAGTYWQFDQNQYAPNTFYAAAKQAFHDLLTYYRRVHSIPSVTLVLYDIFGPNDTRPKLWSKIMEAPAGVVFPLSEGRQLIELVHVRDVANAFLKAAEALQAGALLEVFYAVRSGLRITLRQLLEQVQQRTGLDLVFDWGAIPYWPGQIFEPWHGPVLPGWCPTVEPVEGIVSLMLPVPPEESATHRVASTR